MYPLLTSVSCLLIFQYTIKYNYYISPLYVNVNENLNTDQGKETSSLKTIALVFMIIATVISGFSIIPLAWMIPMTVYYYKSIKNKESVSTGFKVCTLIFVSLISGILMLCDQD